MLYQLSYLGMETLWMVELTGVEPTTSSLPAMRSSS